MGVSAYLSLIGRRRGGRLFDAGRLLTFSAFRMGAYSRWSLIRGWALIRINTVTLFYGGGHWRYPIPQYRKNKYREIPCPKSTKYRHCIYDRSRFTSIYSHLTCLPPIKSMYMHQKSTLDIVRKHEKTLN